MRRWFVLYPHLVPAYRGNMCCASGHTTTELILCLLAVNLERWVLTSSVWFIYETMDLHEDVSMEQSRLKWSINGRCACANMRRIHHSLDCSSTIVSEDINFKLQVPHLWVVIISVCCLTHAPGFRVIRLTWSIIVSCRTRDDLFTAKRRKAWTVVIILSLFLQEYRLDSRLQIFLVHLQRIHAELML